MCQWLRIIPTSMVFVALMLIAPPLRAQDVTEYDQAILEVKNDYRFRIEICDIFVVREPNDVVVDQQFPLVLLPGKSITFSVISGEFSVLILSCNANTIIRQTNVEISDTYTISIGAEETRLSACSEIFMRAKILYNRHKFSNALITLSKALDCYRGIEAHLYEAITLASIGQVHLVMGNYAEAVKNYESSILISQDFARQDLTNEEFSILSESLGSLGLAYYRRGDYFEALKKFQEALVVAKGENNESATALIMSNIGNIFRVQGRYQEAIDIIEDALAIQRDINDRYGEAASLSSLAVVYRTQRRYSEAIETYDFTISLFRDVNDIDGELSSLNGLAMVYRMQGQYNQAEEILKDTLARYRSVGDKDGEGSSLNELAIVYRLQEQYGNAIETYELALATRTEIGDLDGQANTFYGLATAYLDLGNFSESLSLYELALRLHRSIGDRIGEANDLIGIAGVRYAQGSYSEALALCARAEVIFEKRGNAEGDLTIALETGRILGAQRRFPEALERYNAGLGLARKFEDQDTEARLLQNIGAIYAAKKEYEKALDVFNEALTIFRTLNSLSGQAYALSNAGVAYTNTGDYSEAAKYLDESITIFKELRNIYGEGFALNNRALVYVKTGAYEQALELYKQALENHQITGDRFGKATTLYALGEMFYTETQLSEALKYYEESLNTLESVRSEAGSDLARSSFAENYSDVYARVIDLYHQQGSVDQAFGYSERGRARSLLDGLITGQVQIDDSEFADLLAKEQEAYSMRQSAQFALTQALAVNPPDPAWVAEAEQTLKEAEIAYQKSSDAIAARSDQLASLLPGRQKVPQLAEVQALLEKDTTLLSFWMLEDKALAFVITAKDAQIVELPEVSSQTVLSATESLYEWSNKDNTAPKPLRELYRWLIAPLSDTLKTPHIAIIPHQQLHYVPFAALVDESHDNQYFGEQHTLSILPSASVLPFLQENAKAANANHSNKEVIFGDPASDQPSLPRLQHAEQEAKAVAMILNSQAFTDTAATEATLHESLQGAKILHIAAHGEYNQGNALYSSIYLAPSQQVTPTQSLTETELLPTIDTSLDGRLETHEIFGLPLKGNDLVVLSACQTNVGDLSRGDEIVGLTRAFFFAGSPTVISSLWNVDDAATEKLMVSFYTHWLTDRMSKAQALQAAQADVRAAGWESPFFWAGFVLNGDPGR